MATKSAPRTKKAEKNNDQLFPLFLKNLSSDDISEFATAALKLTNWLKVDKAYYPKARPKASMTRISFRVYTHPQPTRLLIVSRYALSDWVF